MRGLSEIHAMNNNPAYKAPALAPLSQGYVHTVVWQLFDDDEEHIRNYVTEVTIPHGIKQPHRPKDWLLRALGIEGLSGNVLDNAELVVVFEGGCIIATFVE